MFRRLLDRALEIPVVYNLNQFVGDVTVRRYRLLLRDEVPIDENSTVLDIGCGTGTTSTVVRGHYSGVDVNPDYVSFAQRNYPNATFYNMDCSNLALPDGSFDFVTTIATTHHLSDAELEAMTSEALRVVKPGGALHLIDAILPVNPRDYGKEFFFRIDRGRFQRKVDELVDVVSRRGRVVHRRVLIGPLHDVAYLRIVPKEMAAEQPSS
jgi:ubiquinone/menaquinone biosynthesis C-methylase UbiE